MDMQLSDHSRACVLESSVMVKRVNAFYAKVFYCLERIDFTEPHSGK